MARGVELAAVGVELIPGIAGSHNLTVGVSTITGGASGSFLYDNSGVVGEYLASATSQVTSVVLRDDTANSYANNFIGALASVTSAAGTTTLTEGSAFTQVLTGTSAQSFALPDATTYSATGASFRFINNSTGLLTVVDSASGAVTTVAAGGMADVTCTSIATAAGVWSVHKYTPSNVTWGTTGPTIANATAIPAGGTAGTGYKFSSTPNFGVFFGSGAPTLAAAKGSLYLRSDGSGVNDRAYINTDGGTTWTALVTVA